MHLSEGFDLSLSIILVSTIRSLTLSNPPAKTTHAHLNPFVEASTGICWVPLAVACMRLASGPSIWVTRYSSADMLRALMLRTLAVYN